MLSALNPTVNFIGFGLIIVGVALLVATLAFWRSAIEDPEVLGPLEVMGERRYSKANDFERLEILNDVRPGGPMPVRITMAPPPAAEPLAGPEPRRRKRRGREVEEMSPVRGSNDAPDLADAHVDGRDGYAAPATVDASGPIIDPLIQFQNKRNND